MLLRKDGPLRGFKKMNCVTVNDNFFNIYCIYIFYLFHKVRVSREYANERKNA